MRTRSTRSAKRRTSAASTRARASRSSCRPSIPAIPALKRARVMGELLPRVKRLAALARSYDIGLNIDAEEADRLELSLDLLEALCLDADLKRLERPRLRHPGLWQALPVRRRLADRSRPAIRPPVDDPPGQRAPTGTAEIKRAQVDGLDGFPVFTRKVHTDVSYLACARKLLGAPDAVFPQFATHNAQTLAAVLTIAGPNYYRGQYEFQCLHGMGEPLYEEVVGRDKLDRPCRIYAPVGIARDAARLSRSPPARERRQHFLRQSHRRRERLDRRTRRRPGRGRPRDPAAGRAAREDPPLRAISTAGASEFARARPFERTSARDACARVSRRAAGVCGRPTRPATAQRPASRSQSGGSARTSSARVRHADAERSSTRRLAPPHAAARSWASATRRARRGAAARRRPLRRRRRRSDRPHRARSRARPTPMRSRKCARRSISCATTPARPCGR